MVAHLAVSVLWLILMRVAAFLKSVSSVGLHHVVNTHPNFTSDFHISKLYILTV